MRSAKNADVLLTVSEYSKAKIAEYYKFPLENIFITPNAVSDDFAANDAQIDIKARYGLKKYILYVSRIEPRKNHIALLQAYKELELWKEGYQLVFIGVQDVISKNLDNFKNEYEELLKDRVIWLEGISFEEIKCFYRQADLFVFPSFTGGLSMLFTHPLCRKSFLYPVGSKSSYS